MRTLRGHPAWAIAAVVSLPPPAAGRAEAAPVAEPDVDGGLTAFIVVLALLAVASAVILMRVRQHVRRVRAEQEQMMRTLISRRNELEAALSSMVEGVLAVDLEGRVISLNDAAAKLLGVRSERVAGRRMREVVAADSLRQFVERALLAERPMQDDVVLQTPAPNGRGPAEQRLYQAQGAVLRNAEGERIGSLIVLHDVTRLRRLEVVRQDFVANASHEIKTPVTAIKAAAETLLEASEEGQDAEATGQFVRMIVRQSDRLQAIVEDLLSLARLEQEMGTNRVPLERGRLADVIEAAVETCAARAQDRRTRLQWQGDPQLNASMHAPLLEQAVVNLLDNAIKYSPEGAAVRVTAERQGGETVISVRDNGPGIAAEHLPRIFERFYRTDKARSRAMGGTGLGLSIVKHIAIAHGGRVSVDSRPGEGSTFRIHLPSR